MKLKLDANGNVVLGPNGGPIYVRDNGQEFEFDGAKAMQKITDLGAESEDRRKKLEASDAKLATYVAAIGDDIEGAKKKIETASNLDSGQLLTAGKVEEMKRALRETAEAQTKDALKQRDTQIEELTTNFKKVSEQLSSHMIDNAFATSKFLGEHAKNTPRSMVRALLAGHFKVEDGKLVAYKKDGTSKVYSNNPARGGELAEPDEAMEILIKEHPDRDYILSAPGSSGGGSHSSGRHISGIDPNLSPEQRITAARAAGARN